MAGENDGRDKHLFCKLIFAQRAVTCVLCLYKSVVLLAVLLRQASTQYTTVHRPKSKFYITHSFYYQN